MTSDALPAAVRDALLAMSGWELAAVMLGIAYLLLAMRQSLWCWYAAFCSTAIFLLLFWQVGLLMESALQVYYLAMAVYGWWQWRGGARHGDTRHGDTRHGDTQSSTALQISRWTARQHALAITGIVAAAIFSGALLSRFTDAALPYLDSFTTWGSIVTTWMVAKKILENWLYWLVIDAASIYLYVDSELYLTALLFVVYVIIVLFGYRQWLYSYRQTSR